jgi:hypothetical protein
MAETPCWDFTKCKDKERCPAYPDRGRDCWDVEGTLCRGVLQGTAEEKRQNCICLCQFMEGVMGGKIE